MSRLSRFAAGKPCTLRFPGCEPGPGNETVVLAHLASNGKGMGIKSPDWWSVHACCSCHDILDGRKHSEDLTRDEINEQAFRWALYETMALRVREQIIRA